jgi:hypothetical protein
MFHAAFLRTAVRRSKQPWAGTALPGADSPGNAMPVRTRSSLPDANQGRPVGLRNHAAPPRRSTLRRGSSTDDRGTQGRAIAALLPGSCRDREPRVQEFRADVPPEPEQGPGMTLSHASASASSRRDFLGTLSLAGAAAASSLAARTTLAQLPATGPRALRVSRSSIRAPAFQSA